MSRYGCMCWCGCDNVEGPSNGSETDEGLCVDCREGEHADDLEAGDDR